MKSLNWENSQADVCVNDIVTLKDGSYSKIMTDDGTIGGGGIALNHERRYKVIVVGGRFPSTTSCDGEVGTMSNDVMMRSLHGREIVFTMSSLVRVVGRKCTKCDTSSGVQVNDIVGVNDGSDVLCLTNGELIRTHGISLNGSKRYKVVAMDCKLPTADCFKHGGYTENRHNNTILQEVGGHGRTVFIRNTYLTVYKRLCTECNKTISI